MHLHIDRMTDLQRRVLAAIPIGIDDPITTRELRRRFGLSQRSVQNIIERLRNHGVPVVAMKDEFHGYFIPRNREEMYQGLKAYKQQIITSQQLVHKIESVDLAEYHKERLEYD